MKVNKINMSLKTVVLPVFLFFILIQCHVPKVKQAEINTIEDDFQNLKSDNTLWCYWYWIGDDISKAGITKDLEAMKAAGIGGALIGNINPREKDGKVPLLSKAWWEHMVHAVTEGKRIGVDIGAFNCPGWSQSGGPWVKAEMAMRYKVYSETTIEGGRNIEIALQQPAKIFQDTYVLAFPTINSEKYTSATKTTKITVEPSIKNPQYLIDGDKATSGVFSSTKNYEINVLLENYIEANNLQFYPGREVIYTECEVQAKIDGSYKTIKSFIIDRRKLSVTVGANKYAPLLIALPSIKAKNYKLHFKQLSFRKKSDTWSINDIIFSKASVMDNYARKTLVKMHPTSRPKWDSYKWQQQKNVDSSLAIATGNVIDISNMMDAKGNLTWQAPKGRWTIQRYGMAPTGTKNSPSAPQGKGFEIDKANKALVQFHYAQFIGEFLKRIPEESKSAFKYVIADSYEMGSQNWTDGLEKKFETKYGYNPKSYLPVFSGRIVGSVEESERFLWDIRRFMADAVAHQYVGGLREASNMDNLQLWLENYGHWGFPSEFLMYGGQSDLVSGEFWNEGSLGNIECKSASSAAHIYGKNRVSAEAFTAANRSYVRHPAMLKKRGDWSFTEGINHLVLHVYIHQPDDKRVPGVNAWFSTEFNRHNTWFKKSKTYFDYLRRCQHLLQQGQYYADVCYFIGEDTPVMSGYQNPKLPKGYSFDYINAEVILNRLSVKNGRFVLPDGTSYGLMVLPKSETMRPEVLSKIESLISQGGKIYGSAPKKSPSLQNYPKSDSIIRTMATKIWSNSKNKIKKYNEGYIVDGLQLKDVLTQLNIDKDVNLKSDVPVLWTHRSTPEMDIYFLTNQSDKEISFKPSFNVSGKKPQLWDAITGKIRHLPEYKAVNNRTEIPITMKANQSWFVVFINSDKKVLYNTNSKNFPATKTVQTLNTTWNVNFLNKTIGIKDTVHFKTLIDWSKHKNDTIKYYSGTAVYKTNFKFTKPNNANSIFINLGKVGVMATVKLNGINIGTSWIAPFVLNATKAIKEGNNTLEIEVVNTWRNRITGDKLLPEKEKTTWLLTDNVKPEEALVTSGLLGPVSVESN